MIRAVVGLYLLFCLSVLPGVLRYFLALEYATSLWLSVAAIGTVAGMTWLLSRGRAPINLSALPAAAMSFVALFVLVLTTVMTKGEIGLFSLGSADGASHMASLGKFMYYDHSAYNGFVGFYSLVLFLHQFLGVHIVTAISTTLYLSIFVGLLVACLFYGCLHAPEGAERRPWWLVALGIALLLVSFTKVNLPLIYYNIGSGFWPHIAAATVFILATVGYAIAELSWLRLAALVGGVVLCRFTYGLNIGDLLLVTGVLALVEAWWSERRWLRGLYAIGGLGCLVVGVFATAKLLEIHEIGGGIARHDLSKSLMAAGFVVTAALALWWWLRDQPKLVSLRRFLGVVALLLGLNLAQHLIYLAVFPEFDQLYYIYKFALLPNYLAGLCIPVIVLGLGLVAWQEVGDAKNLLRRRILAGLALVLVIAAVDQYSVAYKPYRGGLNGTLSSPEQRLPEPLFSFALAEDIAGVLETTGKTHHTTIGLYWSRVHFMNTFMNHRTLGRRSIYQSINNMNHGVGDPPAGTCIFWLNDGPFYDKPLYLPKLEQSINRLAAAPGAQCIHETGEVALNFCHLCN